MGKFEVGVLGGFNGKIGTVVGGRWKGVDFMRHKGRKSTKPPTMAQLVQQAKFSLVTKFVHKIGKVLIKSFTDSDKKTGINMAFEYIFNNALLGTYPDYALDFSKVLVSKGNVPNAALPTCTAPGNGEIKFNWTDNSSGLALAEDKCLLVAYCPELEQAIFKTDGAARSALSDTLNVANFTGKEVQTWISFVSKGNTYATSMHTGVVTVS